MNGYCQGCLNPVTWAFTKNGKRIALNPDPDPKGNQAAYRDARPAWLTRQLKDGEEPHGYERRYMPHVATCKKPRPPARLANVIPISRTTRR